MPGPSELSTLEFQGVQSLPVHTGQEKSIIRAKIKQLRVVSKVRVKLRFHVVVF